MERSAVAALDITQQQVGITTVPPSASPRSRSVCRPSRPPAVVPRPRGGASRDHAVMQGGELT